MSTQYDPEEYSQIMREFAGYKLVIQGRSPRTVNEYMLDLRTFFRFLIAKRQGPPRRKLSASPIAQLVRAPH